MKAALLTLAAFAAFSISTAVFAQEAQAPEETAVTGDTDPVMGEGDLNTIINKYKIAHQDVLDPDKCRCFIGVADIAVPAGTKGHALSRVVAYHKAFLTARQEFGKWLEMEVTSSMKSLSSKNGGLGEADSSVKQSINDALLASLKEQAKAKGIDINDKAAFDKFVNENVLSSDSFKQQVAVAGNAFQQGLMAYKTFATATQVGVLAVYNERNLMAAQALRAGKEMAKRGNAKATLLSQIPTDPKILANTFGTRILRDQNGEYCVVGYGHGVAASNSQRSKTIAVQKASLQAINEIKQFAGEQIVFSTPQEIVEAGGELSDGSIVSANDEKFSNMVEQKKSSLIINGVSPVSSATILLPSGETIVVTATAWIPRDAMKAKQMAKKMLDSKDVKNEGITAVKDEKPEAKTEPSAPKKVQTTSSVAPVQLKKQATTGASDEADLD